MTNHTIARFTKKIEKFCKENHIAKLSLFGSVLTTSFTRASDIDILVQFEKKHIPTLFDMVDMEAELEVIIGHKVDLKTPGDLSPYFRNQVLAGAEVIYDKSAS